MKLKNIEQVNDFLATVDGCEGNVWLESDYGDRFNLKSKLSQYIAIGKLCEEHGDEYEVFCSNKADESYMLGFFVEINK